MLPSKKIGIGASLLVTGVLLELLAGLLLTRSMDTHGSVQGGGPSVAELMDQRLEELHFQSLKGFSAYTLSSLAMVSGLTILLVGVYQTAKRVESLAGAHPKEP
jgi:hypothetical protein